MLESNTPNQNLPVEDIVEDKPDSKSPEAISEPAPEIVHEKKKLNYADIFWSIFWVLLLIILVVRFVVYQQVTVVGPSMEPSYHTDELLLVDQVNKTNLSRGQVVAVYEDKNVAKTANYLTRFASTTRFFLKRVIGLPGEEIEMVGHQVIIYNSDYPEGVVLKEDYVSDTNKSREDQAKYYFKRTKIADNNYFLLGDNRTNSTDSRILGAFPDYSIFGKEALRFWPITTLEKLFFQKDTEDKFRPFQLPDYTYEPLNNDLKQKLNDYKKLQDLNTNGNVVY